MHDATKRKKIAIAMLVCFVRDHLIPLVYEALDYQTEAIEVVPQSYHMLNDIFAFELNGIFFYSFALKYLIRATLITT